MNIINELLATTVLFPSHWDEVRQEQIGFFKVFMLCAEENVSYFCSWDGHSPEFLCWEKQFTYWLHFKSKQLPQEVQTLPPYCLVSAPKCLFAVSVCQMVHFTAFLNMHFTNTVGMLTCSSFFLFKCMDRLVFNCLLAHNINWV